MASEAARRSSSRYDNDPRSSINAVRSGNRSAATAPTVAGTAPNRAQANNTRAARSGRTGRMTPTSHNARVVRTPSPAKPRARSTNNTDPFPSKIHTRPHQRALHPRVYPASRKLWLIPPSPKPRSRKI
ncbi:hypothetical protein GCM10022254_66610 [Actinomadura meridiana]|uniref:Uncharacterized protein n=1 Tax=Actinomadura meridiana TaxID=559626 RepID=A0ABP8CLD2_9ACTN